MISATGVRIGWADLPLEVREAVERCLDDRVVAAVSQPGGFSPGTADRVVTANGRRAFVKAVGRVLNEVSVTLHRMEARVAAALPSGAPAPRLLACPARRGQDRSPSPLPLWGFVSSAPSFWIAAPPWKTPAPASPVTTKWPDTVGPGPGPASSGVIPGG